MGPIDALKKIAAEGAKGNAIWVSRGDNSGTHSKEKALWKLAGLNVTILKEQTAPDGKPWYYEAGADHDWRPSSSPTRKTPTR